MPVDEVNRKHDFLEILIMGEDRCRKSEYLSYNFIGRIFPEGGEHFPVNAEHTLAAVGQEIRPVVASRQEILGPRFLRDLQEQKISQLRKIFMINNSVISQDVAQIPQFIYDIRFSHC